MSLHKYLRPISLVLAVCMMFATFASTAYATVADQYPDPCDQVDLVSVATSEEPDCEPIPVACGVADVDGNKSEWDLLTDENDTSPDYIAPMYRAGNPDKVQESLLYMRFDPSTGTLYFLVDAVNGAVGVQSPDDAYLKVAELGSSTVVDGNSGDNSVPPDFQWVFDGQTLTGFEASTDALSNGVWTVNVHFQVHDDGEDQTSAVRDRALQIVIDCEEEEEDPGSIRIEKTVVGGTADEDDFTYRINGLEVEEGVDTPVAPGTYTASEDVHPDYVSGIWSGDCSASGEVTVGPGESAVCRITNTAKPTTGTIDGNKVWDINRNLDQDDGEPFVEGWTIELRSADKSTLIDSKTTNENGKVIFSDVPFGSYTICELPKVGWTNVGPLCVPVEITEKMGGASAYFYNDVEEGNGKVIKYHDRDKNNLKGGDEEEVLPNWLITLYQGLVQIGEPVLTNTDGEALFSNLPPGDYTACETLQSGWTPSEEICVDLPIADGETAVVYLGNYQTPTSLPPTQQPGGFTLLMPFAVVDN